MSAYYLIFFLFTFMYIYFVYIVNVSFNLVFFFLSGKRIIHYVWSCGQLNDRFPIQNKGWTFRVIAQATVGCEEGPFPEPPAAPDL